MIHTLKYRFYTQKHKRANGNTRFRSQDMVEGEFEFDTDIHYDDDNNYYNVVSDMLDDKGYTERHSLNVSKVA